MIRAVSLFLASVLLVVGLPSPALAGSTAKHSKEVTFHTSAGGYTVSFRSSSGALTITPAGKQAGLAVRELPGSKGRDLLYSVSSLRQAGSVYTLKGASKWASFVFTLDVNAAVPGLLHISLSLTPRKAPPAVKRLLPDVQLVHAPASSLKEYAPAPPISGTSVFLSSPALGSSMLYLANLSSLGAYFDRTKSGATQPIFD